MHNWRLMMLPATVFLTWSGRGDPPVSGDPLPLPPSPMVTHSALRWTLVFLGVLQAASLVGCIDGARVEGVLESGYADDAFGDWVPPVIPDAVPDVPGDVAKDGADVPDGDVGPKDVPDGDIGPGDADVGPCIPGTPDCPCTLSAECAVLDDGNLCNGTYVCDGGACIEDAEIPTCDQGETTSCTEAVCDPASGRCRVVAKANGSVCNDKDNCTLDDSCQDGSCHGGPPMYCDDGNPCTLDKCTAAGCKYSIQSGSCDDGNPCTVNDTCGGGKCKSADNQNVCACAEDADCASYDDGNPCNGTIQCTGGECKVPQSDIVQCSLEPGPCEVAACNPETGDCELSALPDGSGCSDDDGCTVGDTCTAGVCAGTAMACAADPCGAGACDAETGQCVVTVAEDGTDCSAEGGCLGGATCQQGACIPAVDTCACVADDECSAQDDDDLCNGTMACIAGRCVIDPTTLPPCPELDDAQCETATCDPATGDCTLAPADDGLACDDVDPCTESDACAAGVCVGAPVSCEGEGPCTMAVCHPAAGCLSVDVGQACSGGDACELGAACASGSCVTTDLLVCEPTNPCVEAACDAASAGCVEQPIPGFCDDGDACTDQDVCVDGACVGATVACDDGNPCTSGTCEGDGECFYTNADGVLCDDGNGCTGGDMCDQGVCITPVNLGCGCAEAADCAGFEDGNPCTGTLICSGGQCAIDPATVVTCDGDGDSACLHNACQADTGECAMTARADGAPCDDGDLCTTGGACVAGSCAGIAKECDDGNPCTDDFCDAATGSCSGNQTADDAPCDDGNPCTDGTACANGGCAGGANSCDACTVDDDCAASEDGDACNGTLVCVDEACVVDPDTVVLCAGTTDPCVVVACDSATGTCETSQPEGAACEDGDPCSLGDSCSGGVCQAGAALDCGEDTTCGTAACDPAAGGCVHSNKFGSCNDDNPCTIPDLCLGGECLFNQNTCPCSADGDCDAQIVDKCLGTPECGLAGCQILPDTNVVCDTAGDTACVFTACQAESGACEVIVLAADDPCDDGDACTVDTVCDAGGACAGSPTDCDDGNACTVDSCDPVLGCQHEAETDGALCSDTDVCTTGTVCIAGACAGGINTCFCGSDVACAAYEDGNACNGTYSCLGSKCILSGEVLCPLTGLEPCKVNACNAFTGGCSIQTAEPGTSCDDGKPCTEEDRCAFGFCTGDQVPCDDGNACTDDFCDADTGQCGYTPLSGPTDFCDDGDPCTILDKCDAGVCTGGTFKCNCTNDDKCNFLNDSDKCNGDFLCIDGLCQFDPDSIVTCVDENPWDCTDVECQSATGICFYELRENDIPCDDGSVCTVADKCLDGGCFGVNVGDAECPDANEDDCVDVGCHPLTGTCVATVRGDGDACDDHNACTSGDACVAGGCQGALTTCDDDNPCTSDGCSAELGCVFTNVFGPCDDGDACFDDKVCKSGVCQGGVGSGVCGCSEDEGCAGFDDGDACTGAWICQLGKCKFDPASIPDCPADPEQPCMLPVCGPGELGNPYGCSLVAAEDGLACDDGDPCTELDVCGSGACAGQPSCDDDDPCTVDSCDAATGACSQDAAEDGGSCDAGDPCSTADTCQGGVCAVGDPIPCSCGSNADCAGLEDGNVCNGTLVCDEDTCAVNPVSVVVCLPDATGCNTVSCDPDTGSCVLTPKGEGLACNDGSLCTADDRCAGGVCAGTAVDCTDGNACTNDVCDGVFGCVHNVFSGPCDDGNPCTKEDTCADESCTGKIDDCNDGIFCTKDDCLTGIGCRILPKTNNSPCNDANSCTTQDKCQEGVCVGQNTCLCTEDGDCAAQGDGDLCKGAFFCSGSGLCEIDAATIPSCPESSFCLASSCDGATGECVTESLQEGAPCDDGDQCTDDTVCTDGACVGNAVQCDPIGNCSEAMCLPSEGCVLHDKLGTCYDGDTCTKDDHCVAGVCEGVADLSPEANFDDGDTSAWTVTTTGAEATWVLSAGLSRSAPFALHAVNPETGNTEDGNGSWSTTATWQTIDIPFGALIAELRLWVWMDVQDTDCNGDVLYVLVDDAQVAAQCDDTAGAFVEIVVDMGASIGKTVEIALVYDTMTAANNAGGGAVIDDVILQWSCPVKQ